MAPRISQRHHGNRLGLFSALSFKTRQHPYSSAGGLSKEFGINAQAARIQKSSSVGATYDPCACYNNPSTGQTGSYSNLSNSCAILINGVPSGSAPMPLCIQSILI